MKICRMALSATAAAILLLPALGLSVAFAADPASSPPAAVITPSSVSVLAKPGSRGDWQLEARVVAVDGAGFAGKQVQFVAVVDFLGQREVPLGSAMTDVTGRAVLSYVPTSTGRQQIVARAIGSDGTTAEGQLVLDITVASGVAPARPAALPIVSQYAVPVALFVLAAVWALLAVVLIVAIVGVWRGRPDARSPLGSQVGALALGSEIPARAREG